MYQSKKKPSFLQNSIFEKAVQEENRPQMQTKDTSSERGKEEKERATLRFAAPPPQSAFPPPPPPAPPPSQPPFPFRPVEMERPQPQTPVARPPLQMPAPKRPFVQIFPAQFREWKRRFGTHFEAMKELGQEKEEVGETILLQNNETALPTFRTERHAIPAQGPVVNPPANLEDDVPAPLPPETQAEFEKQNPKAGVLRVETFIAGRALPVTDVNIVVTHRIGEDEVVYYNVNTNEVGIVDGLTLPAPDASTSQSPDLPNPFATYNLYATRDRYRPQGPIEIQIFDGIKTIQPLLMQWQLQEGE